MNAACPEQTRRARRVNRSRDLIACAACYAIVFVVLPALFFLAAALRGWRP